MIERLINFYNLTSPNAKSQMSCIWTDMDTILYAQLRAGLTACDKDKVFSTLDNFATDGVIQGVEYLDRESFDPSLNSRDTNLERLAQHLGVIAWNNPEQPSPTGNAAIKDLVQTRAEVEAVLGLSLTAPDFLGFSKESGPITLRRFTHYCAAAHTVRSIMGNHFPAHILEIGSGVGNLGVISAKLGTTSYTVIDIPALACVAAYRIACTLGEEKVWLFGEPESGTAFAHFYACTNYDGTTQRKYDLVFNSDSFPEIPNHEQDKYASMMSEWLADDGFFLSINHESDVLSQRRTCISMNENPRLIRTSRHAFAMRTGYIEEIWQLKRN